MDYTILIDWNRMNQKEKWKKNATKAMKSHKSLLRHEDVVCQGYAMHNEPSQPHFDGGVFLQSPLT